MESMREQEGREGQRSHSARERNRTQPPSGFEGMNYEQKRRPYKEEVNRRNGGSNQNISSRREPDRQGD